MQALLILWCLKIVPAQQENLPIVPPQQAHDGNVEQPGADHGTPLCIVPSVHRRQEQCPTEILPLDCLDVVDRDQNSTAENRHNNKHVATHIDEAHKDSGVQAG